MIITSDDILGAMENAEIAKTKKKFAEEREAKKVMVNIMVAGLDPFFDMKASERTLLRAATKAVSLRFDYFFDSGESPKSASIMALRGGVGGAIAGLGEYAESIINSEHSPEHVIKRFGLVGPAADAYRRGATIGELFLLQPSLFI